MHLERVYQDLFPFILSPHLFKSNHILPVSYGDCQGYLLGKGGIDEVQYGQKNYEDYDGRGGSHGYRILRVIAGVAHGLVVDPG